MKHTKYWPYLKWSTRIFWGLFILFVIIINLTGCKETTLTCQNNTTCKIIYNTTIKEVFIDRPCNCSNETIFISSSNNTCDLSLINQIKILERTIDRWAMLDINITINETNTTENDTNSS